MSERPSLDEVRDAIHDAAVKCQRRAVLSIPSRQMSGTVDDYVEDIEDEVMPLVRRLTEEHP